MSASPRRWRWASLPLAAVALVLGTALALNSRDGGGSSRAEVRIKRTTRGSGPVLVRARVVLVDADEEPVSEAQVVLAPSVDAMRTEDDISRIRKRIDVDLSAGEKSLCLAIGRTDLHGVVDLEYVQWAEADNPLFEKEEWVSTVAGEFPFGAIVRHDDPACGSVFSELRSARSARFRRVRRTEGSKGPWWVAEAEFVVNCARGVPLEGNLESPDPDAAEASRVGEMVREAQGQK